MKNYKVFAIILLVLDICLIAFFVVMARYPLLFTEPKEIYELGVSEMNLGQKDTIDVKHLEKAVYYYNKSMEKGYEEIDVYENLFKTYNLLSQKDKAEDILNKGIEKFPEDLPLLYERAQLRKNNKQLTLAAADFDKMIKLDTAYNFESVDQVYYQRGGIYYLAGDTANAEKFRLKAKEVAIDTLKKFEPYTPAFK